MTDPIRLFSESHDISAKVAKLPQARTKLAFERFSERVREAAHRAHRCPGTP
jgi:hypothetical protein